tara:strand:- start:299 stop:565 length:267 start_codon:yes stop_codon:yes gene_type:complete
LVIWFTGLTEIYENNNFEGSDASNYIASVVEETLIHEATHTSIDNYHYPNGGWINSGYNEREGWIETLALVGGVTFRIMQVNFHTERI